MQVFDCINDMGNLKNRSVDEIESDSENESPPSYEVEELSTGVLYNRELNVTWPDRPKFGYYSMEEYRRRKAERKKNNKETISHLSRLLSNFYRTEDALLKPITVLLPERPVFVGVYTSSRIHILLRPTEFVLYYRRPEAILSLDDIPVCLPLTVGYMSSKRRMYHFGIQEKHTNSKGYTVKVLFSPNNDEPTFSTLRALVNYYEIYGNLKKNGDFEIFPVPD